MEWFGSVVYLLSMSDDETPSARDRRTPGRLRAPEVTWVDPSNQVWSISSAWAAVQDPASGVQALAPVSVTIAIPLAEKPADAMKPQVLSRAVWRAMPASVLEDARAALFREWLAHPEALVRRLGIDPARPDDGDAWRSFVAMFLQSDRPVERPGRGRGPARSDEFLGYIATKYQEARSRGGRDASAPAPYVRQVLITDGVVDDLISNVQIRKWFMEARKRGYLPPLVEESDSDGTRKHHKEGER